MSANHCPSSDDRPFGHNPFEALKPLGLPEAPPQSANRPAKVAPKPRNRGRVEIRRVKAGRGGKTVTVVSAFIGTGLREKEQLAQHLRKACGTGGTVKEGCIEIQGDQRETVARLLAEAGFRPVLAGG